VPDPGPQERVQRKTSEKISKEIVVSSHHRVIAAAAVVFGMMLRPLAAFGAAADDTLPPPPATAAPPPAPSAPAAAPAAPAAAAPAAAEANKPQVTVVGALELTPVKAVAFASRINTSTCIGATVRLRIKNTSSSDVKVALLLPGISAVDDLGQSILASDVRFLKTSGVTSFTQAPGNGWMIYLGENAANLSALSPGQTVEVQLAPSNPADWRALVCTVDPTSQIMKTYRPTSYSLSGSFGVVDLDGNAQVRSFSLLDVPLQATARQ
jgi:hypothetical protein